MSDWSGSLRRRWRAATIRQRCKPGPAQSADFAAGATGDVHVFQAAEGVRLGSAWARTEWPILSQNPDVNLIFNTVGGG